MKSKGISSRPPGPYGRNAAFDCALVAAHHQPLALLAVVDEQVGVAQGRQALLAALAERLGDEVLVRHRDHRDSHPRQAPELGRVHPAGDDDHLGLDLALVGHDASHPPALGLDRGDAVVGEHRGAALAGAVGQRVGELRRVDVAVGRQPGRADDAVGRHQREHLLRLVGRDQVERKAERLRPAGLAAQLLHPLLRGGQPQAAALDPAGVELRLLADPPVEVDRVHHHLRQRDRAAQLAHESRRVEARAGRELVAVDEDDVAPAELREVVGDRGPADAAADDHAARGAGQLRPKGHRPPRAIGRSAGPRRSRASG